MVDRPDLIIAASAVIDGNRSAAVLSGGAVAIAADGIIVAVGPLGELRARWPLVHLEQYADCTILPGLFDCHAHLTMPGDGTPYEVGGIVPAETRHVWAERNARLHLAAGVTTIRDVGSHLELIEWAHAQRARSDLPRMLTYGPPITRPRGHGHLWGGECEGPTGVRGRVSGNLAAGADGIKVMGCGGDTIGTAAHLPAFELDELRAAAQTAHERGALITAHAPATAAAFRAIRAGFDGLEHIGYLDGQGRRQLDDSLVETLASSRIYVCATVSVNFRYLELADRGRADPGELERERGRLAYVLANAGALHQAGVRLLSGTDAGWKYTRFGDIALELGRMAEAGIPPREVIHAATAAPAAYLRLNVGRVVAGREADLLVVRGDPERDIRALQDVRAVYRLGRRVLLPAADAASTVVSA